MISSLNLDRALVKRTESLVVVHYFVREHTACANKYIEGNILRMLDILINNIFVEFGGRVFQQNLEIPMNWIQLVRRYQPICFYTLMKQNSCEITKRNWPDRSIFLFAISMMCFH